MEFPKIKVRANNSQIACLAWQGLLNRNAQAVRVTRAVAKASTCDELAADEPSARVKILQSVDIILIKSLLIQDVLHQEDPIKMTCRLLVVWMCGRTRTTKKT